MPAYVSSIAPGSSLHPPPQRKYRAVSNLRALASTLILARDCHVKKLFGFVFLAVAAWLYFHEPAAAWRGMPAAKDPVQLATGLPKPFSSAGYTITPLARYTVTAI